MEPVRTHTYIFPPRIVSEIPSGENLTLITKFFDSGNGKVFMNQELVLHSYSYSASFNLTGNVMSPTSLRTLATQLEAHIKELEEGMKKD